jgi:hypothetical protein
MKQIDPDILAVLKNMAGGLARSEEHQRVAKVRAKHGKQLEDKLETYIQLKGDELEAVLPIPRSHPLFMRVLYYALIHKLVRNREGQDHESSLDSWPKDY